MPTIRKGTVLSHELDGELVLYDPDSEVVHTLNTTARFIWEHCDGAHGIEGIVRELTARFDISPDVAQKDVEQVLAQLQDLALIHRSGSA